MGTDPSVGFILHRRAQWTETAILDENYQLPPKGVRKTGVRITQDRERSKNTWGKLKPEV